METTVIKGLQVLESLAADPKVCGVTAVAQRLRITKSNAHRLLKTLAAQGYVASTNGQYGLTLKLWELGAQVVDRLDVNSVAQQHLQELARLTGETVHLSVLDGPEVVYIAKVDSPQPIRAYSRVGGRAPAHAVATGKVLLAHAPDRLVDGVLLKPAAYTDATITSAAELAEELSRIRDLGYAVNRGEWREGVWGVAAAIRDSSGEVMAAVGLSGPSGRFKPENIRAFAHGVCEVSAKIATDLGYRGNQPPAPARAGCNRP